MAKRFVIGRDNTGRVIHVTEVATTKEAADLAAKGKHVSWVKVESLEVLCQQDPNIKIYLLEERIAYLESQLAVKEDVPEEAPVKRWSNGKIRK